LKVCVRAFSRPDFCGAGRIVRQYEAGDENRKELEGPSNLILESMVAGKPVVATNVGANVEILAEGRTGHLVPPADSE